MLNTADYRCRACGASISEVSGLCGACEPPLPMVDDRELCRDCGAYLFSAYARARELCADCAGDFDDEEDEP